MTEYLQLIGGRSIPAVDGGTRDLINPATEQPIGPVSYGDAEDVKSAIDAAAEAADQWAAMTPFDRADILARAAGLIRERAGEYAAVTTEESGKPIGQSIAEWESAPNYLTFAAEEAKRLGGRVIPSRKPGRHIDVTYHPIGVVGVITAWNFPIYNINRAASSALAAGCTVVIRPSEYTPRSALLYGQALVDAGIPPGVINVVNGAAHPMGQAMLDDPRLRKIQFTGSSRVGRLLMDGASRTVTDLSLEMGGNAPVLVFPDTRDLAEVAASGVTAKYRNCGQVCVAPQRFIVHASIVEEFTALAAAATEAEVMGNPAEPSTTVGPLINAAQRDRVEQMVVASVDAGAVVVTGGARPSGSGYFYEPTVMTNLSPDAPVATDEVFGPVLPIVPFDTTDEAIAIANGVEHGLASFVWTSDLKIAMKTSAALEFGMVGVNDWYPVTPEAPFGGVKQSGLGRESGTEGLLEYVEAKTRFFGGLG